MLDGDLTVMMKDVHEGTSVYIGCVWGRYDMPRI